MRKKVSPETEEKKEYKDEALNISFASNGGGPADLLLSRKSDGKKLLKMKGGRMRAPPGMRPRYRCRYWLLHFFVMMVLVIGAAFVWNIVELQAERDLALAHYQARAKIIAYLERSEENWDRFRAANGAGEESLNPFTTVGLRFNVTDPTTMESKAYIGMLPKPYTTLIRNLMEDVYPGKGHNLEVLGWAVTGSVWFVVDIITTIGYGSLVPKTLPGKMVVCVVSILGISYFGYALTLVSNRVLAGVRGLAWLCGGRRGQGMRPPRKWVAPPGLNLRLMFVLSFFYICAFSATGPVLAGWEPLDSLYFAAITFTTVGLGDFAPEVEPHRPPWFRVGAYFVFTMCIVIGLAILSGTIEAVHAVILDRWHPERRTRPKTSQIAPADEGGMEMTELRRKPDDEKVTVESKDEKTDGNEETQPMLGQGDQNVKVVPTLSDAV